MFFELSLIRSAFSGRFVTFGTRRGILLGSKVREAPMNLLKIAFLQIAPGDTPEETLRRGLPAAAGPGRWGRI